MAVTQKFHVDQRMFWVDEESCLHIATIHSDPFEVKLSREDSIDLIDGLMMQMQHMEREREAKTWKQRFTFKFPW